MIEKYIQALKKLVLSDGLNLGDADTVLEMIYDCYNENHPYDNEEIKVDFNELYRQMNGMALREMDNIIYPVSNSFIFFHQNCQRDFRAVQTVPGAWFGSAGFLHSPERTGSAHRR